MSKYDDLIEAVKNSGKEFFWYGSAPIEEVDKVETLLNIKLPHSYRRFLCEFGGGGVVDSDISGIEDGNGALDNGGTIYGDTLQCREDYNLPNHLAVFFYREDEICWCFDTDRMVNMECPLVSYNLFKRKVENDISSSFEEFFTQYLELRTT